jgi:hypothetical protein
VELNGLLIIMAYSEKTMSKKTTTGNRQKPPAKAGGDQANQWGYGRCARKR